MKKAIFLSLCLAIFSSAINTVAAQDDKIKEKKQEEIVIRKNGNADSKLTIEIKNGDVLINGKPLADFNDSTLTVVKRSGTMYRGKNLTMPPRAGNSFYYSDDNEEEPRAFLGVSTEKDDKGVKIKDVSTGSAAEKAGLKEGDIISKLGDKKIDEPQDLVEAVRAQKPKSEVKIYYQRNGKATDTKVILGERRERRMKAFSFNGEGLAPMDMNMMKDFKLEMPPLPNPPFHNFQGPQNKRLGVKIEDTADENGVKVANVEEGSAAEKAGLKKDDIITEVDGDKVKNTDEVREKVQDNEKSAYTIKAKRGSTEMSFDIKIPKKLNSVNL